MDTQHVVIEDPEGRYYEGSIVDPARARQLSARGACVLPFAGPLMKLSGAGGWVKRAWGAGWPLDTPHPAMTSQVLLYVEPTCRVVHWAARVVPHEEWREGDPMPQGSLRLAADSSQRVPNATRVVPLDNPVDVSKLGKPDARGGWTVRGKASVACGLAGHYGFAVWGNAPSMRVLWAALSTTER